jgi:hypothetical protein
VIPTLAALTMIVIAVSGVASLALLLYFLWRVYERGGRADLTSAGRGSAMPVSGMERPRYDGFSGTFGDYLHEFAGSRLCCARYW